MIVGLILGRYLGVGRCDAIIELSSYEHSLDKKRPGCRSQSPIHGLESLSSRYYQTHKVLRNHIIRFMA